jgi:phosphatidylinositol kinase/protein kinase (PI-3  family)
MHSYIFTHLNGVKNRHCCNILSSNTTTSHVEFSVMEDDGPSSKKT